MAGADLLKAPTGTAVAQQSETGLGILGAEEGKGMWVWSAMVVLAVLSSRMSAGGCSLAGRRDNVPCLAITAIFSQGSSEIFSPRVFKDFLALFFSKLSLL